MTLSRRALHAQGRAHRASASAVHHLKEKQFPCWMYLIRTRVSSNTRIIAFHPRQRESAPCRVKHATAAPCHALRPTTIRPGGAAHTTRGQQRPLADVSPVRPHHDYAKRPLSRIRPTAPTQEAPRRPRSRYPTGALRFGFKGSPGPRASHFGTPTLPHVVATSRAGRTETPVQGPRPGRQRSRATTTRRSVTRRPRRGRVLPTRSAVLSQ